MQKVLDFLEKHVQWIAIALGGIYMLWMVWAYVINNPAKVTVPGAEAPMAPGDVDRYVYNTSADKLDREMQRQGTVALPNPKYDQILTDILNPSPLPALAAPWVPSMTTPVELANSPTNPNPELPRKEMVTKLPTCAPAADLMFSQGRSNVTVPPPPPAVAGGPAVPGQPQQPIVQPVMNQPGQGVNVDKDWVTVQFRLPINDVSKQFQDCKIPTQFRTCVLQIELLRQEQDANGNWGGETAIPALETAPVMPFPQPGPNNKGNQGAYVAWASQNPPVIVQPQFYPVVKGDSWHLPGVQPQMVGAPMQAGVGPLGPNDVRQGFDPNSAMTQDPRTFNPPLTMKERQLISKAKQDKARQDAAQRAQQRGSQRGGAGIGPRGYGGGETDNPGFAPNDQARPAGYGGAGAPPPGSPRPTYYPPGIGRPRTPYPYPTPDMPEDMGGMEGEGIGMGMAQQPQPGNQNVQGIYPLPTGEFDPRLLTGQVAPQPGQPPQQPLPAPSQPPLQGMMPLPQNGDLVGWAHDATVKPGKTYRYRIRYHMKNPVWNTGNVAGKNLAMVFDLVSEPSAWTPEVHIPLLTQFFVTSVSPSTTTIPTASVDVFRYQDGVLRSSNFRVAPGDLIGKTVNGVDFGTGITVVDVRPASINNPDPYVMLMDSDGTLLRRDFKTDSNNPDFQRMRTQVQQAQAGETNPYAPGGALAGRGPGG